METIEWEDSDLLMEIWEEINESAFENKLRRPAAIGWQDISDEPEADGVYGTFGANPIVIGITRELRRVEELVANYRCIGSEKSKPIPEIDSRMDNDNFVELFSAVRGLVAHEVAHQAAYTFDRSQPMSHGTSFVINARKIADSLEGLPPVVDEAAENWPFVHHVVVKEREKMSPQ